MVPKKLCTFTACDKNSRAAGFCTGHYQQHKRGLTLRPLSGHALTVGMTPDERFWFRVEKTESHWLWTGANDEHGYGHLLHEGRWAKSHRLAWELTNGPIPTGAELDHMCHVPACVNPNHLQLATRKTNNENKLGDRMDSRTGIRGVSWDQRRNKYFVRVTSNKRAYWGGYFTDISKAEEAAISLRNELFTNNLLDRMAS